MPASDILPSRCSRGARAWLNGLIIMLQYHAFRRTVLCLCLSLCLLGLRHAPLFPTVLLARASSIRVGSLPSLYYGHTRTIPDTYNPLPPSLPLRPTPYAGLQMRYCGAGAASTRRRISSIA